MPTEVVMTMVEEQIVREALQKCGLEEKDITFFCLMLQRMDIFHPSTLKEETLDEHIKTIHTMYKEHFDPLNEYAGSLTARTESSDR